MKKTLILLTLLLCCLFCLYAVVFDNNDTRVLKRLDAHNIVWDSPSESPAGSMPFGGGDIGGNVWVEAGNIYFYLQRSGSFSDNGEYMKLGRYRVTLTPNPFDNPVEFRQELNLTDGYVSLMARKDKVDASIKLWVDITSRSVHLTSESNKQTEMTVSYESWRTEDRELIDENRGRFGCFGLEGYPGKVWKSKDNIRYNNNGILFFHRNNSDPISPAIMIEQQGVTANKEEITNRNSNLTFGGFLFGNNLIPSVQEDGIFYGTPFKSWGLKSSKPGNNHHITVATHIEQTATADEWEKELKTITKNIDLTDNNLRNNIAWWNNFWQRSWIVTDPQKKDTDERIWQMGRNYQLMRYQLGCNLYGDYPSKFNGGNFTFDPVLVDSKMTHDPDWRQWGGDVFTAQNQRLLYWPMLKSGDFDGMKSQFNLYEWGLNGAMAKVKTHFGHNGAIFSEYANASGLDIASGWGWEGSKIRQRGIEIPFGDPRADATKNYNSLVEHGLMANQSISYHWESQVEHAYMILEYHRFTGKNIDQYMPFIKNALIFFDEHYQKREQMRNNRPLDENGKLVIFPSTSCESYRGAKNPADLVSGIRSCLEALISLPGNALSLSDRTYYQEYLNRLPDLYFDTTDNGDKIIKPAESYIRYQNVECPQFYPLFPFNRFDIKSNTIPVFKNTWKHGNFPKDMVISWHQDGIFYARMGMTAEAYEYNMNKLKDSPRRFPTFWGPGHDWVPDHNWGGSGMIGLQEMLLQTVGDKIHVLPAWPEGKDVCFKLHAPDNTTIEVEYLDGKLKKYIVTPQSREKDVEILIGK